MSSNQSSAVPWRYDSTYVTLFSTIVRKSVRSVTEVQETLGQELLKFIGIRTIELV